MTAAMVTVQNHFPKWPNALNSADSDAGADPLWLQLVAKQLPRVGLDCSNQAHSAIVLAQVRGCGSLVRAASAAATSWRLARTYVLVVPASLPLSV